MGQKVRRMISCQRGETFVVRKCQPIKHALSTCLTTWKTEATIAPDPSFNKSIGMNHGLEGEKKDEPGLKRKWSQ